MRGLDYYKCEGSQGFETMESIVNRVFEANSNVEFRDEMLQCLRSAKFWMKHKLKLNIGKSLLILLRYCLVY